MQYIPRHLHTNTHTHTTKQNFPMLIQQWISIAMKKSWYMTADGQQSSLKISALAVEQTYKSPTLIHRSIPSI